MITREAVALIALAAAACGERPAPPPSPIATREAPPMRPLTSRDGVAPSVGPGAALPPGHPAIGTGTAAEGPAIEGEIRLGDRVGDKVRPGDVLYVIARNAASRQVAAVRKEEGARFPFSFRLSSADAMMEGVPFEGPFEITARLSRSGDAIPQAGDLEGTVKGVAAGSRGVTVIIDTIRP